MTHAFVELNGRDLGLYVLLEAENRDFLGQYFKNTRGNLYEAYLQDIDQRLDQDNGKETSQADLKVLLEATKEPNAVERWKRLNQVMDVDRFISFTVLEMFVSHTDGYAFNRNNFRLYHDPYSDRMTFLTHGIDWAFGNPGISIRPPLQSLVVKAVLQTPEGRRLYRERVPQLFTNCFRVEVLTNRVNQQVAKLKAAARNPNEAREFENYGANLRNMIVARAKNIAEQLAAPEPEPLKFDAAGMARLPGWRAKTDSGEAKLETLSDAGKSTLHINANKAACVASWRSRIQLAAGKYRFEGKARATGVVPQTAEPGIGAGIRISGGKRTNKLSGDADWTALVYEFEGAPTHHASHVPVKLVNNPIFKPFELLLAMFAPPAYGAFDPTWVLAVCVPLFFGFVIGDIGFGLVALAVALLFRSMAQSDKTLDLGPLGIAVPPKPLMNLSTVLTWMAAWSIVFGFAYGELFGSTGENLGIERSGKTLVIEGRQRVATKDTLFFKMWNMLQQQYRFEFVPANLAGLTAFLEDSYLGTSTAINLSTVTKVNFAVTADAKSSAANRFKVVFRPAAVAVNGKPSIKV